MVVEVWQHLELCPGLMLKTEAGDLQRYRPVAIAGQVELVDLTAQARAFGGISALKRHVAMMGGPGRDMEIGGDGDQGPDIPALLGQRKGQYPAAAVADQHDAGRMVKIDEVVDGVMQAGDDLIGVAMTGPEPFIAGAGLGSPDTVVAGTPQVDRGRGVQGHQLEGHGTSGCGILTDPASLDPGGAVAAEVDVQDLSGCGWATEEQPVVVVGTAELRLDKTMRPCGLEKPGRRGGAADYEAEHAQAKASGRVS